MIPQAPRPILPNDDVGAFDCGEPSLNEWLSRRALRNERTGDSRTYVSLDETGTIAGYYCLSAWTVAHAEVGGGWLKRNPPDPVSVVLLGRLAVHIDARGLGLGGDLLADALHKATEGAAILGARALIAEALDESAGSFYAHHGLRQSPARPQLFAAPLR